MDILLAHGYFIYQDVHEQAVMKPYPPLGILYLSSHLKGKGFDVGVFDSTFQRPEDFQARVQREQPAVVGLYANMLTRQKVIGMIKACRNQGSIVIVGGPDPANYPEAYLARGADVVVIGEGELTLEALLPHLARRGPTDMQHIRGIVYQEDGQVIHTELRPYIQKLNDQPFPDRAAIDIPRYIQVWREHHGQGAVSLITARGCPYTCTWCSHAVFGYTHRRRSVENVIQEVELILDTYRPDLLWYADDVFTINQRWLQRYAAGLRHRGIRIPFETISREDRLDEEVIQTLADMGCFRLWVGAESGSQRILDGMKRRTDAQRVSQVIHLLQKHGIEAGMFIMLGYEGEEMEDLEETVALLKEADPDRFLTTVAYPIKNTPYYEQVAERVIPLKPWERGSDRDLTVAGRHSRRFYDFATRWMVNEVAWHQGRNGHAAGDMHMVRAFLNARLGRLGMWWTRNEVEK